MAILEIHLLDAVWYIEGRKSSAQQHSQRSLGGKLLNKAAERLGRYLGAKGLWKDLLEVTLWTQRYYLRQCKYVIV